MPKNFIAKTVKSQETKNFTLIIIVIAGINFVFVSQRVRLRDQCNLLRPLQNGTFCPISASASNFNPRNIQYISAVDPPEADRLP